jgi:hypothetical protein
MRKYCVVNEGLCWDLTWHTPSITRQSHTTAMHQTGEMVAHTLVVFSYLKGGRSLSGWIGVNCQDALGGVCLGRASEDACRSWRSPRSMSVWHYRIPYNKGPLAGIMNAHAMTIGTNRLEAGLGDESVCKERRKKDCDTAVSTIEESSQSSWDIVRAVMAR